MNVILVDNFDSFTHNVGQYLYEVSGNLPVTLPNTTPYASLPLQWADAIVLSPGPGRPSRAADFGVCRDVLEHCDLPVLGICLGHQGIAEFFGASTVHAPEPVHGIVDSIDHTGTGLFDGLPQGLKVVRYHSLVTTRLPATLEEIATNPDGIIMGVAHRHRPLWGVQFHPESIESQGGRRIFANFLKMAADHKRARERSPKLVGGPPSTVQEAFRSVGGSMRLRFSARRLEDAGTPEEEFTRRYADDPHAFWLDSENSEHPDARVSVMGGWSGPGAVSLSYDVSSRTLTLDGVDGRERVEGDLFELIEEIKGGISCDVPDAWQWPFKGGLVGYLGYELQALTSGEAHHRSTQPDACFLHTLEFLLYDHRAGSAYLCTAQQTENPVRAAAEPGSAANHVNAAFRPGPVDVSRLALRDEEASYLDKIKRAQDLICEGESYEICLTNRVSGLDVASGLEAYARMRRVSPVPYGAFLRFGDLEILSSSPETFLRIDAERVVESRPIKGTRPRGQSPRSDDALRNDLRESVKDRAENLMIVDLVRHDLNTVCEPGSVHVPAAFAVESYSSVHQLVSTIRGTLRTDRSAMDAVRACFPGGSMTGAPKKRTMEIIAQLEGEGRGVYSGALGWLGYDDSLDLNIVIRTVVIHNGVASFGVGGAITSKSSPEEEFEEILVKTSVPYFALSGWRENAP